MSIDESSRDMEQRWRAWQEKSKRVDRLAGKRMNILFSAVGALVLLVILYRWFQPELLPDFDIGHRIVAGNRIPNRVA